MKTITVKLSDISIDAAIKELNLYRKWVEEKTRQLSERLALIGAKEASVRFATAMYDGVNDSNIEVSPYGKNGWAITASGESVCFIEFGAGVYHNPTEPYPIARPDGIVGIGEYGKGYGKRNAWGYYNDLGELVITRGNPASMPMYNALKEMEKEVKSIAKEIFASD